MCCGTSRWGRPAPVLLKQPARFTPDPLDAAVFAPFVAQQRKLFAMVSQGGQITPATLDFPVLKSLFPGFKTITAGQVFFGKPDIGVIFFENTRITPDEVAASRRYARIVAGSSWNRDVLQARGVEGVELVLQGIDPVLFHPMPRRPFRPGAFTIFSGGKLEARKGQDIVLAAFRRFHARHPDSVLVTAWQNAWPEKIRDIGQSGLVRGRRRRRRWHPRHRWLWPMAPGRQCRHGYRPQGHAADSGCLRCGGLSQSERVGHQPAGNGMHGDGPAHRCLGEHRAH